METISTTKMSSKGQVVIPETVRKKLNLGTGTQFVVVGEKGVIILKTITPPSMNDFHELLSDARKNAKLAGLKRSDILLAVSKVRGKK